jgi:hypothetical protein
MALPQVSSDGLFRTDSSGIAKQSESGEACCCSAICPYCAGFVPSTWDIAFSGVTKCTLGDRMGDPRPVFPDAIITPWSDLPYTLEPTGGGSPAGEPRCHWFKVENGGTYEQDVSLSLGQTINYDANLVLRSLIDVSTIFVDGKLFTGTIDGYAPGDCEAVINFTNTRVVAQCAGGGDTDAYGGTATATPVVPP